MKLELKWCHTTFAASLRLTTPKNRLKPAFAFLTVLLAGSFWLTPNSSKATAGPGENPVQLRFAAMDAILHGNNKDALDLYETAIQEASQQYGENSTFLADLYYEAGTAALDSSQFPVAERYLTLAVKINPYSTMAKIKLAELYRLQERPDEASKQFRQAVQINPSPVTRQAYIRWLATNGRTPQENAIATQESLKLAMLTSRSNENSRQLNLNSKGKQAASASQMPVLPPALIAPLGKEKAAEKTVEKNTAAVKDDAKPKPAISLFPFKSVAKEQVLEKEKLEKQRKQEAAKQEAAAKARLAEEREQERERAKEREREHEAQLRKKASAAEAKAKAAAPAKKAEVKPAAAKPEEKPAPAKVEKIEKVEKKEPKQEPKKEQPKAVEQPNIVPSPQQPSYPQTIYGVPVSVKKPTGKAARTMVPPPPPMPIFPGVQPMMRPPMPNFQAPPQQVQQPAPVTKPKPVVKPKVEAKEQPEDKPPPMTNQSENEPEFILDWGEVKPKGKKGK